MIQDLLRDKPYKFVASANGPSYFIIDGVAYNASGHPLPDITAKLKQEQAEVFRQDEGSEAEEIQAEETSERTSEETSEIDPKSEWYKPLVFKPKEEKKYHCHICDATFDTWAQLNGHRSAHKRKGEWYEPGPNEDYIAESARPSE